ncbi:hypothetical protein GX441_03220 [bacterium]|nr:hypothetical protein [bacterium]
MWRSWRLECRLRSRDEEERRRGLLERENELYSLYRELALRDLGNLVDRRRARLEEKDGRDRED